MCSLRLLSCEACEAAWFQFENAVFEYDSVVYNWAGAA
jgi:hypothetical protein